MARPRSGKVESVLEKLRTRLKSGVGRPGDRFLSTREVASGFEISYQTAHRVICELERDGLVERRAGSGTFLPGQAPEWRGAQLLFSSRARRLHSFGARLLSEMCRRLERDRIVWKLSWVEDDSPAILRARYFPVVWEAPQILALCEMQKRAAILLNQRPQPGLAAAWFDSASLDDFSGGVCAAQLLLKQSGKNGAGLAMLSGPPSDSRALARRAGFQSLAPRATIIEAKSWYLEDGYKMAPQLLAGGARGVFCGNDRLAQAMIQWCGDHKIPRPPLVGFDDAPIAEALNFSTIAIPWDEMTSGAIELLKRRLGGDTSAPRQLIITPRPIVRA